MYYSQLINMKMLSKALCFKLDRLQPPMSKNRNLDKKKKSFSDQL